MYSRGLCGLSGLSGLCGLCGLCKNTNISKKTEKYPLCENPYKYSVKIDICESQTNMIFV